MSDQSVRISHPFELKIKSLKASGSFNLKNGDLLSYLEESSEPSICTIIFELEKGSSFNSIQFEGIDKELEFLPDTFRFEISDDAKIWEAIIKEYDYTKSGKKLCRWNFPMITTNFLKLVTKLTKRTNEGTYKIAFEKFKLKISGIEKIQTSSELDRLWVKENIIDGRPDYGWSSREKTTPAEEYILVDLGSVNRVDEIRILSKNSPEPNFPDLFYFYYSEDDLAWHQLHEEPNFIAESGTWYKWKFFPTNMRFFKLVMFNNKPNSSKKYVSQIVELEIYAAPDYLSLSRKKIINETPPYASVIRSGLVRLAADGETNAGVAVQGNDRRLRDATTEFKGIVELATDGEDREGVVVQGNDKRLKNATELSYGLVKLARNGENRKGVVVQGDDERLKPATTESLGIVELAEDGETRPGVVVQGNDSRLKKATKKDYGLVILAELGEDTPGKVVTADDPRFKKATTEKEGIMRFALNGEESAFAAVQGNDKRLRRATTETPGIVELAHSGENKEGVVVQGNDERLKHASEEAYGISRFARHGVSQPLLAVQSDDPRLSDPRTPLPHTHEYAEKVHSYDSHIGLIHIVDSTSSEWKNITLPTRQHAVIYGRNQAKGGGGIVGIGIDNGIVGNGEDLGVVGLAKGVEEDSAGIAGFSDKGYGGVFVSSRNFAIHANGNGYKRKEISGSGKAILATGESEFRGTIRIIGYKGLDCLVRQFKVQSGDIIQSGDVVVASDKEGSVARSRTSYSTKVLGVCVDSASILLGEQKLGDDLILVAFSGFVYLHVDAVEGAIVPGDLLVTGLTGGHAVKADPNRLKPGMLVAKALGECKKDRAKILSFICIS